jgi:hypothetical protein
VIHVTVAGDPGRRRRRGVRIHRSATLEPVDITRHRGIPVTAPIRTLLDVATTVEGRPLEQVLDRAERLIDSGEGSKPTRPGRDHPPYKRCCRPTRSGVR